MDTLRRHRTRYRSPGPRRPVGIVRRPGRPPALASGARGGDPAQLRLPIPPGIVRMVEQGLALPEADRAAQGWWRWVERRMHRFVFGRLPAGAVRVALALDPDTLEVVARFERGARP